MHWNLTIIDGIAVTWVGNQGPYAQDRRRGIASILDPHSNAPARRITRDGVIHPLEDSSPGLTVFGTHVYDRPQPEAAAELAPEYTQVLAAIAAGRGTTQHRVTAEDPMLGVAEIAERWGISPSTVSRYKRRGDLPAPDSILSGRPRWRASTIDAVQRPGRGRRTDLQRRDTPATSS